MQTASTVLYRTPVHKINTILSCIAASNCIDRFYVIDNSPTEENKQLFSNYSFVEYIEHENTGYGSSHNIALHKAIEAGSDYHVVLNPDIEFDETVLSALEKYMDANKDVVYILPKVIYPNGDLQYLCKLLPTPFDLFLRRFLPKTNWTKKLDDRYSLVCSGYNRIINPPCLSGCFMFMRVAALKEYGIFFDERYFMYLEDFDLIRRLHRIGKTIFYPEVTIIHNHAKESYKNIKMLFFHIKSAIKYFNKFGWVFDKERMQMNREILKECNASAFLPEPLHHFMQ